MWICFQKSYAHSKGHLLIPWFRKKKKKRKISPMKHLFSISIFNIYVLFFIICRFQAIWSRSFTRNWEPNDLAMLKLFWPSTADYWVLAKNKCKHLFKLFLLLKQVICSYIILLDVENKYSLGFNTAVVMLDNKTYYQPNHSQIKNNFDLIITK